jgi:hypothetical protein
MVFSSAAAMANNSEVLLMFAHYLRDELASNILVVDGTFRGAGITSYLGLNQGAGLVDLLSDESDIADAKSITKKLKDNISFIPVGQFESLNLPFVFDKQIASLCEDLRQKYDYVLVQQEDIRIDTRYLAFAKAADMIMLHLEERVTKVVNSDEMVEMFSGYGIRNVKYILSEP